MQASDTKNTMIVHSWTLFRLTAQRARILWAGRGQNHKRCLLAALSRAATRTRRWGRSRRMECTELASCSRRTWWPPGRQVAAATTPTSPPVILHPSPPSSRRRGPRCTRREFTIRTCITTTTTIIPSRTTRLISPPRTADMWASAPGWIPSLTTTSPPSLGCTPASGRTGPLKRIKPGSASHWRPSLGHCARLRTNTRVERRWIVRRRRGESAVAASCRAPANTKRRNNNSSSNNLTRVSIERKE